MTKAPKRGTSMVRPRGLAKLEAMRDTLPAGPPVLRDAELEAVIAEEPDEEGRYLVYADWLQLRDDSRGLLISLQHAAHQHPRDEAREEAAAAYLQAHRHVLLGRLEPYARPGPDGGEVEIELDWFM